MNPLLEQFCSFDTADDNIVKPARKPAHSVSFSDHVRVFDHWKASHFTQQERESIWYTRRDLYNIQLDAYYTTLRMEEAKDECNPAIIANECVRGLEAKTPTGMRQRHRNRKEAAMAVLDIQQEQRRYLRKGEQPDPEPIARAYAYSVRESEERAYNMGLLDHQAVLEDEAKENKPVGPKTGKLQQTLCLLEVEREPLANVPPTPKNGIAIQA